MKKWTIALIGFFLSNILLGASEKVEALVIKLVQGDGRPQIAYTPSPEHIKEYEALPEHEKSEVDKALIDIAINPSSSSIGYAASRIIKDQRALGKIVQQGSDYYTIERVLPRITDQHVLCEIVKNGNRRFGFFRDVALKKITAQDLLEGIVADVSIDGYLREDAFRRLPEDSRAKQTAYANILTTSRDYFEKQDILAKQLSQKTLSEVAKRADDKEVRDYSIKQLTDQNCLVDVAINSNFVDIASLALKRLNTESLIFEVAKNAKFQNIRFEAIACLTDEAHLFDLVKEDADNAIRMRALKRITNETALIEIAKNNTDLSVRKEALARITSFGVLEDFLKNDTNFDIRHAAALKLSNENPKVQAHFTSILMDTKHPRDIRKEAIGRILDQKIFAEVVKVEKDIWLREMAFEKLTDRELLIDIAKSDIDVPMRKKAVNKINDSVALVEIMRASENDADFDIRHAAALKLPNENPEVQAHFTSILMDTKHPRDIRKDAIGRILDQKILAEFVKVEKDIWLREMAFEKLTDQALLIDIAKSDIDVPMRKKAVNKINDSVALVEIMRALKNDSDFDIRHAAALKLSNENPEVQAHFTSILMDTKHPRDIRKEAIGRILDQKILAEFVKVEKDIWLREMAFETLTDQALLIEIAKSDIDVPMRKKAVNKINDSVALVEIMRASENDEISQCAFSRLPDTHQLKQARYARLLKQKNINLEQERLCLKILKRPLTQATLADVAQHASNEKIRLLAIKKLEDQEVLKEIVLSDSNIVIQECAIQQLTNKEMLLDIAQKNALFEVRIAAKKRLAELYWEGEELEEPEPPVEPEEPTLDF